MPLISYTIHHLPSTIHHPPHTTYHPPHLHTYLICIIPTCIHPRKSNINGTCRSKTKCSANEKKVRIYGTITHPSCRTTSIVRPPYCPLPSDDGKDSPLTSPVFTFFITSDVSVGVPSHRELNAGCTFTIHLDVKG